MTRRTPQRPPASRFLRTASALLMAAFVLLAIAACLAGAAGRWKGVLPAVTESTWLAVAGTLFAATVAAGIALFVLVRQLRAQEDRDHQNRLDDDERARHAHEVAAAADLSAHLARAWPLADTSENFIRRLRETGQHAPSALSDLHRLTSVWINWTEDALWPRAGLHPRELLTATARSGKLVHNAALDGENVSSRFFFRTIMNDEQQNELERILQAHDFLSRLARDVVVMPMWDTNERADTLRHWMAATPTSGASAPAPEPLPAEPPQ